MIELKVPKKSLWCFWTITLLVHLTMVKIQYQYLPVYDKIRTASVILLLIMILPYLKIFFQMRRDILLNISVLLFVCSVLYSSIINRGYESSRFMASIQYAVGLAETFFIFQIIQHIDYTELAKKIIYYWILFYCLLSDFLMFIKPNVYGTVDGYLVGNKFQISYLHIILFVLYYALKEGKKNKDVTLLIHFVGALAISFLTGCSTALIGCGIIAIMIFMRSNIETAVKSWCLALGVLTVCDSLLLVNAAVLTNKHIGYFIQEVMGKDPTLTGRLRIYSQIHLALEKNIWFGSGIENNHTVTMRALSAANAQNGILDCIVSFGIVGLVFLGLIFLYSFKRGRDNASFAFYLMVYTFIAISMVEVTLKQEFIVFLAMVGCLWDDNYDDVEGDREGYVRV